MKLLDLSRFRAVPDDLEAIWEEHCRYERSVRATLGDLHARVIRRLSLVGNPSRDLDFRLQVLAAGGLNSHIPRGQALRACKAAWEVYLFAAFACGLFSESFGLCVIQSLIGIVLMDAYRLVRCDSPLPAQERE